MSGGAKYPGPVDFKDNQKGKKTNSNFCSIFLEVPGLKVGMFGGKPANADVSVDYQETSLNVKIQMTDSSGSVYGYEKSLPEDIDPQQSNWKAEKDTVILHLFKKNGGSWTEHANFFIRQ